MKKIQPQLVILAAFLMMATIFYFGKKQYASKQTASTPVIESPAIPTATDGEDGFYMNDKCEFLILYNSQTKLLSVTKTNGTDETYKGSIELHSDMNDSKDTKSIAGFDIKKLIPLIYYRFVPNDFGTYDITNHLDITNFSPKNWTDEKADQVLHCVCEPELNADTYKMKIVLKLLENYQGTFDRNLLDQTKKCDESTEFKKVHAIIETRARKS